MKISYALAYFILSTPMTSIAATNDYKLEVRYPNHEVKIFAIPQEGMDLKLQKSKWQCKIKVVPFEKDTTQGIVVCQVGELIASTWGMCVEGTAANIVLALSEPKKKNTQIFLKCNMKE